MMKAMNKFLWVIETLLMVIILITVFIVALNFFQLKIQKKDHVSFFGYTVFEVVSNSMAPTIEKKDVIIVKLDAVLKVDDIVTYKLDNAFVTHRIKGVEGDFYLTQGDANNTKDTPIKKDEIIGKVVKIIPSLGVWRDVLMTPKVLISIVITLALLNYMVLNDKGKVKKKRNSSDFKISYSKIIEECEGDTSDV